MQQIQQQTLQSFLEKLSALVPEGTECNVIPLKLMLTYFATGEYSITEAIQEARYTRLQLLLLNPQ